MSYDDHYVYFALFDNELPHDQVRSDRRIRDDDLRLADRMCLRIDTDLDLITSMQLEVTSSGRTRDTINGHPRWQPAWYVATQESRSGYHFEIAIERRDLQELPIVPNQRWFVSAREIGAGESAIEQPIPDPAHWLQIEFR